MITAPSGFLWLRRGQYLSRYSDELQNARSEKLCVLSRGSPRDKLTKMGCLSIKLACLIAFMAIVSNGRATTYYVDYVAGSDTNLGNSRTAAWMRAPGMAGFSGLYTHAAGDVFIFKGGVAWPSVVFPWTVKYSGASGNPDTFTADRTWFSGSIFSQPTFDANHTQPAGGMLNGASKSHLTFDELHFTNYGTAGVGEGKKAIDFLDCQGLSFTRCTFDTYSWLTLYIHFNTPGTYTSFNLVSNTVSHTTSLLWFASSAGGITMDRVNLIANTAFDFSSQIGADVHGDGFVHFFSVPSFQINQPITNVVIANNYAYGDFRRGFGTSGAMTGFIFNESVLSAKIYNNVFAPSPVQPNMFEAFIVFSAVGGGVVEFYNNTLVNAGPSSGLGINTGTVGANSTLKIRNNIAIGFNYPLAISYIDGNIDCDYNLFRAESFSLVWGETLQSYTTWRAAGRDVHGVLGLDPLLVNPPLDVRLQSGSPAKDSGSSMAAYFSNDRDGNNRVGVWDIGAYEYGGGAMDVAAPVISALSSTSGATNSMTVTWTTDEPASTILEYGTTSNFGSEVSNLVFTTQHSVILSGLLPNITYQYRAKSVDASGNLGISSNFSFIVGQIDTIPPTVSVTFPASAVVIGGSVTLAANATDNVAVAAVQFLIDGQLVGLEDADFPYAVLFDTTVLTNGSHSVACWARDTSGNTNISAQLSMVVQNALMTNLDTGLVGYWAFEEARGVNANQVGNRGGAATLVGGATWVEGKVGNALGLNGADGHATVADTEGLRINGNLSLALWVNHSRLPTLRENMHYLEKGQDDHDNYGFGIGNSDQGLQLYFEFEDTGGVYHRFRQAGQIAVSTGEWVHMAVTFDDTNNVATFYKDGLEVGRATVTNSVNGNIAGPVSIGCENVVGFEWYLSGAVDSLRIYNRKLSTAEVIGLQTAYLLAVPSILRFGP